MRALKCPFHVMTKEKDKWEESGETKGRRGIVR